MRFSGFLLLIFCGMSGRIFSQDTTENNEIARMITLSEVVVHNNLNISKFIELIKNDTTFYKAFKNLRVIGFSAIHDIKMQDKQGHTAASLHSKTRQKVSRGCRTMQVLEETTTGNFYKNNGAYNYYTAELFAALFFTKGQICGETNIVGKHIFSNSNKLSGIEKRKEQMKMLFFNPGKKIPGIPFMGEKSNIFDKQVMAYYDMKIDFGNYNGRDTYIFTIKTKDGLSKNEKGNVVFDNMITWFDAKSMEILARNYDLSYSAGLYDFDVHMEVQLGRFGSYLVPVLLRYSGSWDVAFKRRERGFCTTTIYDFSNN